MTIEKHFDWDQSRLVP